MKYSRDFGDIFCHGYTLVTINVVYYLPDYTSLINEFIFQTLDKKPKYPRIERFLEYWRQEVDAVIKDVNISDANSFDPKYFRRDDVYRLH
jgi:uncharacterized protein Usg